MLSRSYPVGNFSSSDIFLSWLLQVLGQLVSHLFELVDIYLRLIEADTELNSQ